MELTIEQELQQGVTAHNAGNLQEAERVYQSILQRQPKHPDANHNLGLIAISVNQIEAALLLFKTALDVNPNIENFWMVYIDALVKNNQLKDAKKAIKNAKKKGFDAKKLQAVLSQSKDVTDTKVPSQAQVNTLREHYQNGRFGDAEKLAISVTHEFPQHQFSWKVLGAVLGATGRNSEAVDANQTAVALSPQDAAAHSNLGISFHELGRLEEALTSYTQAIALKPDYAQAHSNLGVTLQELRRLDEAEASYTQAIALKPDYAQAHYNLGITLQELGRLDEALASYTQAIVLKPDYALAHYNLGNTLKELGRLKEAEASYKQAIALKPDYAEAHSNLGETLQKLGRLDEAEASYTQAIALKPDFVEARMNLNSVASSVVPAWHLSMMNDEVRNKAYSDALKLAVADGDVVLDIGTGSGLLSLMAAASGAEKVITCETSKTIAKTAKEIIDSNGYKEKINVLNKKSTDLIVGVDLPERADLLISEVLSAEFVGEGVRTTILDANKRLLKKGGRMIPQSGKIKIALIDNSSEISNNTSVANVHGFDLSKFNSISQRKFNIRYRDNLLLLSNPEDAFNINLNEESEVVRQEKTIKLRVNQDGLCVGLVQWIWIHLYKDIEYENKPGENDSHWITPIYLFDKPIVAKVGDVLKIKAVLGEDYVWFCRLT
jgi:tetratricopeptide (TPR) repeat protein